MSGVPGLDQTRWGAVHTMAELKLSGNHLKGSRPVLSFHKARRPVRLARLACAPGCQQRALRARVAAPCRRVLRGGVGGRATGPAMPGWVRVWNANTNTL